MCKTRHIQQRMSQRGIKQAMLDIALNFGKSKGDKVILNRKAIDSLLRELEQIKKNAIKMRERGGMIVVKCNERLVTTYPMDNYVRGNG